MTVTGATTPQAGDTPYPRVPPGEPCTCSRCAKGIPAAEAPVRFGVGEGRGMEYRFCHECTMKKLDPTPVGEPRTFRTDGYKLAGQL